MRPQLRRLAPTPMAILAAACNRSPSQITTNQKVGTPALPDPLVLENGKPVRDAKTWFKVRPLFPASTPPPILWPRPAHPRPLTKSSRLRNAFDGLAIHKDVLVQFGKTTNAPTAHLHLYLPANATGPVPVLLHVVFFSNPPISNTNSVPASSGRRPPFSEAGPITNILAHGYGYATFRYTDIQPDSSNTFASGVIALSLKPGQDRPALDEWGTISAWAWGIASMLQLS